MVRSYAFRAPTRADPQDRSLWIKEVFPQAVECTSPLAGHVSADIIIIGGGLTGLWTAHRILERSPNTQIALLEADFCGAGASGRNGGQLHSWFNHLPSLFRLVGADHGLELAASSMAAIDEMSALQDSGTLDMGLNRTGWIWAATTPAQGKAWEPAMQLAAAHGHYPYQPLDTRAAARVTGGQAGLAGVIEPGAGSIQPFRLVRSLRQSLLDRGLQIFEGSPVVRVVGGDQPFAQTAGGTVHAKKVLIANNAWAGSIRELNQRMFTFDAQVIATQPAPGLLDEIGLIPGQAVSDSQLKVLYWLRTPDGRLLMGRGSGIPVFRDRLGPRSNRNRVLVGDVLTEMYRLYPMLRGLEITHDWVGSVDFTASRLPLVGWLRGEANIAYCVGWSGSALAQIPVVARMVAEMLLSADRKDPTASPLISSTNHPRIVPEPARFVGSTVVKAAVDHLARQEALGKPVDPLTRAAVGLVPKYRDYRF